MAKKDRKKKINSLIAPLTDPKQVRREIQAQTRLKYGETQRDIAGAKRASRQHAGNIKSWYRQHQRQLNNLRQSGLKTETRIADAAQRDFAAGGQQDAANRAALQADEDRSAAIRGVVADTSGQSSSLEAANQRQNLGAITTGRIRAQSQANANFLGQVNAASKLGRNAMLREERNVRRTAKKDMRALKREKGDFRVAARADLRTGERDFWLQRKTLAGKADYNDAIRDVARLGVKRAQVTGQAGITQAQLYSGAKIKSAQIYGKTQGKNGKGGKPFTGEDIQRAQGYIAATVNKEGGSWRAVWNNPGVVKNNLINRGVDPKVANIAVQRYININRKREKADKGKGKVGSKAWQNENDKRSGRG
jgi:hypothetical protein